MYTLYARFWQSTEFLLFSTRHSNFSSYNAGHYQSACELKFIGYISTALHINVKLNVPLILGLSLFFLNAFKCVDTPFLSIAGVMFETRMLHFVEQMSSSEGGGAF